jgi:UDP-2-acetamido-3-amino-2,3-dideoxy-glucuronate N-acetyltransferase
MGKRKFSKSSNLIHPTALIHSSTRIGKGTRVWAFAQVRENAVIGRNGVIGNGAYIDKNVRVGHRCNIHNKALLYRNLVLEDDVFVGPGVCFVNDPSPRANRTRSLKGKSWRVKRGASIGANCIILSDVQIGQFAMIGAGSVVTRDVPDFALVRGVPARIKGRVDRKGKVIKKDRYV